MYNAYDIQIILYARKFVSAGQESSIQADSPGTGWYRGDPHKCTEMQECVPMSAIGVLGRNSECLVAIRAYLLTQLSSQSTLRRT